MPAEYRSPVSLVRKKAKSVRVTIPDGIARPLGAVPGSTLVWTLDLKAGSVAISVEPPKKSSKRA